MRTVYLYSFGGVRTRMFNKWLHSCEFYTNGQDNVHHGNLPFSVNRNDLIIYLYGKPEDAVFSFYGKVKSGDTDFIWDHCKNLKIPFVKDSVEEYVEDQKDKFRLYVHMQRYFEKISTNKTLKCRKLIVNSNELWNNEDELKKLLGVNRSLPKQKQRTPKPWLTPEIKRGMKTIYQEMNEDIRGLEPIICLT